MVKVTLEASMAMVFRENEVAPVGFGQILAVSSQVSLHSAKLVTLTFPASAFSIFWHNCLAPFCGG